MSKLPGRNVLWHWVRWLSILQCWLLFGRWLWWMPSLRRWLLLGCWLWRLPGLRSWLLFGCISTEWLQDVWGWLLPRSDRANRMQGLHCWLVFYRWAVVVPQVSPRLLLVWKSRYWVHDVLQRVLQYGQWKHGLRHAL
jgi:hypothetical protein